jgi:P-type E1-E2 ATPase
LVRRLQGLQALATVDTVVFDKTGTLTHDAFALAAVQTREGVSRLQALSWAGANGVLTIIRWHRQGRTCHSKTAQLPILR